MRIAQLTDLHARFHLPGTAIQNKRQSRAVFDLLPETLELIAAWKPDLLAVTGDLLDVPLYTLVPTDYYQPPVDHWPALARNDYQKLKDLLDASGLRYTVLPGNHDLESAMWEVFDPEPRVFECAGHKVARFYDREWFMNVPKRIDRERRLWEELLADDSGLPQIHLQHYVIEPTIDFWYPYNYYTGANLRDRMAESGKVVLSLSGHYHDGTDLIEVGGTTFATGAVFGETPHHITFYEIGETIERTAITLLDHPHTMGKAAVFITPEQLIATDSPASPTLSNPPTILPGAAEDILRLKAKDFVVILLAHDPEVGTGHVTWRDQFTFYELMADQLVQAAGNVAAQPDHYFTTQSAGENAAHPDWSNADECPPSPMVLEKAFAQLMVEPSRSYLISRDPDWLRAAEMIMLRCTSADLPSKPAVQGEESRSEE